MPQKLSAGKRWVTEVLEALGHTRHEWGPAWSELPRARGGATRRETEQLILHAGPGRKIVWLPTEELRQAGAGSGIARAHLRDSIADALSELLARAG